MTFYLVLFDGDIDHREDPEWIRVNCEYPIKVGLLQVAIGHMKHWDSSMGKNTARAFALSGLGRPPSSADILVNLDADNVMHARFLSCVSCQKTSVRHWPGKDSGVTGRVSILADVFAVINGYDQDLPSPTGYQDMRIMKRASPATTQNAMEREERRILRISEWVRRWLDVGVPHLCWVV